MQVSAASSSLSEVISVLVMTAHTPLYAQLRQVLEDQGFAVDRQLDTSSNLSAVSIQLYDLILIGPMLDPDADLHLCIELRRRTVMPLMLLTERYQVDYLVQALELGVDRVIPLPFETQALIAYITALLRRTRWARNRAQPEVLSVGPISLSHHTHTVTINQRPIILAPLEYRLLRCLMQHANQPVSKAELASEFWTDQENIWGNIEVAIRRLRNKIEDNPSQPRYLVTLHRIGYKLQAFTPDATTASR